MFAVQLGMLFSFLATQTQIGQNQRFREGSVRVKGKPGLPVNVLMMNEIVADVMKMHDCCC